MRLYFQHKRIDTERDSFAKRFDLLKLMQCLVFELARYDLINKMDYRLILELIFVVAYL